MSQKRITHEIKTLKIVSRSDDEIIFDVGFKIIMTDLADYPFRCPLVSIEHPGDSVIFAPNCRFINAISRVGAEKPGQRYVSMETDNWSPAVKMIDIIDEILTVIV